MLNLDKANLVKVGGKVSKVVAVAIALPLVVVSAVLEGEVGPVTRNMVSKVAFLGEYVGEIVVQEAPVIARKLFLTAKSTAYAALDGALLLWTTLVKKDQNPS